MDCYAEDDTEIRLEPIATQVITTPNKHNPVVFDFDAFMAEESAVKPNTADESTLAQSIDHCITSSIYAIDSPVPPPPQVDLPLPPIPISHVVEECNTLSFDDPNVATGAAIICSSAPQDTNEIATNLQTHIATSAISDVIVSRQSSIPVSSPHSALVLPDLPALPLPPTPIDIFSIHGDAISQQYPSDACSGGIEDRPSLVYPHNRQHHNYATNVGFSIDTTDMAISNPSFLQHALDTAHIPHAVTPTAQPVFENIEREKTSPLLNVQHGTLLQNVDNGSIYPSLSEYTEPLITTSVNPKTEYLSCPDQDLTVSSLISPKQLEIQALSSMNSAIAIDSVNNTTTITSLEIMSPSPPDMDLLHSIPSPIVVADQTPEISIVEKDIIIPESTIQAPNITESTIHKPEQNLNILVKPAQIHINTVKMDKKIISSPSPPRGSRPSPTALITSQMVREMTSTSQLFIAIKDACLKHKMLYRFPSRVFLDLGLLMWSTELCTLTVLHPDTITGHSSAHVEPQPSSIGWTTLDPSYSAPPLHHGLPSSPLLQLHCLIPALPSSTPSSTPRVATSHSNMSSAKYMYPVTIVIPQSYPRILPLVYVVPSQIHFFSPLPSKEDMLQHPLIADIDHSTGLIRNINTIIESSSQSSSLPRISALKSVDPQLSSLSLPHLFHAISASFSLYPPLYSITPTTQYTTQKPLPWTKTQYLVPPQAIPSSPLPSTPSSPPPHQPTTARQCYPGMDEKYNKPLPQVSNTSISSITLEAPLSALKSGSVPLPVSARQALRARVISKIQACAHAEINILHSNIILLYGVQLPLSRIHNIMSHSSKSQEGMIKELTVSAITTRLEIDSMIDSLKQSDLAQECHANTQPSLYPHIDGLDNSQSLSHHSNLTSSIQYDKYTSSLLKHVSSVQSINDAQMLLDLWLFERRIGIDLYLKQQRSLSRDKYMHSVLSKTAAELL